MDGDGPHMAGDRCLTTRRIGGAERSVTSEITHIDPPNTWGVRVIDGPIRAIVDVTVSPLLEPASALPCERHLEAQGSRYLGSR